VGDQLRAIVASNGFQINESKTRLLNRHACQEITGITINTLPRGLNVKRTYIRRLRAMLHAWEKWGKDAAQVEFWGKYDRRNRLKSKPDFARVVRGKIEHLGFIRGRDDIAYVKLLEWFKELNPDLKVKRILAGEFANVEVIHRAVWVVEQREGDKQGTAFSLDGYGFLTAAHVVGEGLEIMCPAVDLNKHEARPLSVHAHVDVARLDGAAHPFVSLQIGSSAGLKIGDPIRVLGFPRYTLGGTVTTHWGRVSGIRPYHGVTHYVVDCPIVRGASGGPVLDSKNRVVGIAVKGQQIPWRVGDDDELSSFVRIEDALAHL
jgi:S1-C subfamily serine protease